MKYYARSNGRHYHVSLECPMLNGGQFEHYGYKEVSQREIKKHKLWPCPCACREESARTPSENQKRMREKWNEKDNS